MAIQGLGQYSGSFYSDYRVGSIPSSDADVVSDQDNAAIAAGSSLAGHQNNAPLEETEAGPDNRSRIANLEDVSLSFNREDTFDYIGSDSEIGNLDIQKAVSDMKKDQILQEYQYFYGSVENRGVSETEDGSVMQKLYY